MSCGQISSPAKDNLYQNLTVANTFVACKAINRSLEAGVIDTGALFINGEPVNSASVIYHPDTGSDVQPDAVLNISGINGLVTDGDAVTNTVYFNDLRSITPFIVGTNSEDSEYTSVNAAIVAANAEALSSGNIQLVWIKAGTYTENVTSLSGVTVYGGSQVNINGTFTVPPGIAIIIENIQLLQNTLIQGSLSVRSSTLSNISLDGGSLSTVQSNVLGTVTTTVSGGTLTLSESIFLGSVTLGSNSVLSSKNTTFNSTLTVDSSIAFLQDSTVNSITTINDTSFEAQTCKFQQLDVSATVPGPFCTVSNTILGSPSAAGDVINTISGFAFSIWNAILSYNKFAITGSANAKFSAGAILNLVNNSAASIIDVTNSATLDIHGTVVNNGVPTFVGTVLNLNGGPTTLICANISSNSNVVLPLTSRVIVTNTALTVVNSWIVRGLGAVGPFTLIESTSGPGNLTVVNNAFFNNSVAGSSCITSTNAWSSGGNVNLSPVAVAYGAGATPVPVALALV